jgi:hypothetical protein
MTSEIQVIANQRNSKLGGVKTDEGKSVSRLNAIKHGILSRFVLPEEEEEANNINKGYIDEYEPQTITEDILIERATIYTLRLRRAEEAEKEHLLTILNPIIEEFINLPRIELSRVVQEGYHPKFRSEDFKLLDELFLRYENQLERSLLRILHELQRLKAIREGKGSQIPLAIDVSIDKSDSEKE